MPVDEAVQKFIREGGLNTTYLTVAPSPTLSRSAIVKEWIKNGKQIINSTAGQPDLLAPELIREAGAKPIMEGSTGYTNSAGDPAVREEIADLLNNNRKTDYTKENILIANGLKEGLYLAIHVLLNPGQKQEVIIPSPFWGSYRDQVYQNGGLPVIANGRNADSITSKLTPNTKAVILNYPGNPDGEIMSMDDLRTIAKACTQNKTFMIFDIVYKDIVRPGVTVPLPHQVVNWVQKAKPYVIEGDGLSKAYGLLTGIRTGYIIADEQIIHLMTVAKDAISSNTNIPGQKMLAAAMKMNPDEVRTFNVPYTMRLEQIIPEINKVGEKYSTNEKPAVIGTIPPGTFYATLDFSGLGVPSVPLANMLTMEANVAFVPYGFGVSPDKGLIRASFATSLDKLAQIPGNLERFLDNHMNRLGELVEKYQTLPRPGK